MRYEWPLTERQQEVLRAIRELSANGRAPTQEELGRRIGVSSTLSTRRFLGSPSLCESARRDGRPTIASLLGVAADIERDCMPPESRHAHSGPTVFR